MTSGSSNVPAIPTVSPPPSRLAELPERVLPGDRVVGSERPQVAAPHLDPLALDGRPADRPFRQPSVATDEVAVAFVVDVGDALEARGQPSAHLALADEPPAPRVGAARGLEHAVLGEVGHDRVEVVTVEGLQHLGQDVQPALGHGPTLPAPSPVLGPIASGNSDRATHTVARWIRMKTARARWASTTSHSRSPMSTVRSRSTAGCSSSGASSARTAARSST